MPRLFSLIVLVVSLNQLSFAQDSQSTILMMTGKIIEGKIVSRDSFYVYYDYEKASGKVKQNRLDLERVFSITTGEEEDVVYYMDADIGNYFTIDEMRYYIKGEQDASEYYKANWTIWAGLPITAGLSYVTASTIIVFAVPFAYLVAAGLPKYKIKREATSSSELISEPAYVLGYERTARQKRVFKALATGLVGTVVGIAARSVVSP